MQFVLKLFSMSAIGLAAHVFYKPTEALGGRFGLLSKYAIGGLALIFAQSIIVDEICDMDCRKRQIIAGLLAAGGVGTGVAVGHLLDWVRGE